MKLQHLTSLRRYRRCTQIFRSPLRIHAHVAAARRRPLRLELVQGGSLTVSDVRQSRPIFDWLLERSPNPLPVTLEHGQVVFHHPGWGEIALRPSATDFAIFGEVFGRDVYGLGATRGPLTTVVDIGANIGLFALRVAPIAERVVCVEPVSENVDAARQLFARAQISHKVALRRWAVTANSGETARIFLSSGNTGAHSMRREHTAAWGAEGYEDVPTISLADLFEREQIQRCSLLKCDVEGSEFEIFRCAPLEILSRIDRLAMEVHLTVPEWGEKEFAWLCDRLVSVQLHLRHEPIRDRRGRLRPLVMLYADRTG